MTISKTYSTVINEWTEHDNINRTKAILATSKDKKTKITVVKVCGNKHIK